MGCRSWAWPCVALCTASLFICGCNAFDHPSDDRPSVLEGSPPSAAAGTPAVPPRSGTVAMPTPTLEPQPPPPPIGPPPPPPSCDDGGELVGPGVAFQQPFTRCFTWDELTDATLVPRFADAGEDAGMETDACPQASTLDWGPMSEACTQRPFCDGPIDGLVPADEDAGSAPPSRCCYWVAQVCGI